MAAADAVIEEEIKAYNAEIMYGNELYGSYCGGVPGPPVPLPQMVTYGKWFAGWVILL